MKRLIAFVLALLITVSFGTQTFAVEYTSDDRFYNDNSPPILLYSSTYSSTCTSNAAAGNTTTDKGNEATAWNYFVGKGLSGIATAAILGNLKQESDYNPKALNPIGPHYGIAQWDTSRASTLRSQEGSKYDTLNGQLDYVWWEFQNTDAGKSGLKILQDYKGDDASELVLDFGSVYEGYDKNTEVGSRPEYAKAIYKQYGNGGSTTGTNTSCTNTGAGDFVYYSQTDPKWANSPYGSGTVGIDGCGPTSLAMIVATFFDKSVTPDIMATLGAKNGSFLAGTGTIHSALLDAASKQYGFTYTNMTGASMDTLENYVKGGGLIYLAGSGAPPFTTGGHVTVMRGVTSDGQIIIGDPYRGQSDIYSPAVVQAGKGTTYGISKS